MEVAEQTLRAVFAGEFGRAARVFSAPGRVNLIGEHTDYNGGFVLPVAIDRRTRVAAAARSDGRLCVLARDLGERASVSLREPHRGDGPRWMAYVEGMARTLMARGCSLAGADLAIASEVPRGAGLSSSAALEVATGSALLALAGCVLPEVELALAAQAAEHDYAGTRCGIMDQYIACLGRAGHALLIDCRSLAATAVPLVLGDAALLVCESGVEHRLASSAYNERRADCERGVELLGRGQPQVQALRDVSLPELEARRAELPGVTFRRCRHVVTENVRTMATVEALRAGDLATAGRHLLDSHASLRDDYEVSVPELDWLVEVAAAQPGVYGSRLTGAGFGGCTITLLATGAVEAVSEALVAATRRRYGRSPACFVTLPSDGVRED